MEINENSFSNHLYFSFIYLIGLSFYTNFDLRYIYKVEYKELNFLEEFVECKISDKTGFEELKVEPLLETNFFIEENKLVLLEEKVLLRENKKYSYQSLGKKK